MYRGIPKLTLFQKQTEDYIEKTCILHGFTDGSFKMTKTPGGGTKREAGWGACTFKGAAIARETSDWQAYGPVVEDDDLPNYIRAKQKTVNTGELSGLYYLLKHILKRPYRKGGIYYIHSDSTYAIGRALTKKKSRSNRELVHEVRKALQEARSKHGYKNVILTHVRSHTGHYGNDTADKLAEWGRSAKQASETGNDPTLYVTHE